MTGERKVHKRAPTVLIGFGLCFGIALSTVALSQTSSKTNDGPHVAPPPATFTLVSGAEAGPGGKAFFTAGHGHHAFFGRGGTIDGKPNPTLHVKLGQEVKLVLLDMDKRGQPAQLAIPDLGLTTSQLSHFGETATLSFVAKRIGTFAYTGRTVFDGKDQHMHTLGLIVVEP